MSQRTIAQRELRNDIARVLREAEAGTEFIVTVRGHPVARLGPSNHQEPAVDVDLDTLRQIQAATPVDDGFGDELRTLRDSEPPASVPWTQE